MANLLLSMIQATSQFSPNGLTGTVLWLDANDTSTMSLNGSNLCASWANKGSVPLGAAATQGTDARKPTYVANVQNGKGVLRFAGGQILDLGNNNYLPTNSAWTMFMTVGNRNFGTGTKYQLLFSNVIATNTGSPICMSNDTSYRYLALGQNGTQVTQRTTTVIGAEYYNFSWQYGGSNPTTAGSYTLTLKGAANSLTSSGALAGFTSNNSSVGGEASQINSTFCFNGDICEIIIYNYALSAGQITSVNNYLKNKWGLS